MVAWMPLFESTLVLLGRHGHPLAGKAALDALDLSTYPWVTTTTRGGASEIQRRYFFEHGLNGPTQVIETNSLSCIIHIVETTDALHIIPRHLVDKALGERPIITLPLPTEIPAIQFGVVTRGRLPVSTAANRFIEAIREAAESM